jgi:hypothetical protein
MANVNCTVYFREHGTSKIYAVEQAKGRVGCYGIRWYEGTRQRQKIIGQYPAAVAAKLRKEVELKKARQKASCKMTPDESMTLDAAIEMFVRERDDLNPDSARRWKLELDLFKEQSGKVYLCELTREDVFAYRKWEWAKNPKKYADLLAMETSKTNIREEARYSTSEWGVKFRLMGDGLDDWRRRFLGSQREVAIATISEDSK